MVVDCIFKCSTFRFPCTFNYPLRSILDFTVEGRNSLGNKRQERFEVVGRKNALPESCYFCIFFLCYLVRCSMGGLIILFALRLDKMGIAPPKSADCWNDRTLQAMLQNPVYIGKIRWNVNKSKKRIVNNTVEIEYYKAPPEDVILVDGLHPAIVDEAVFQKAQDLMKHSGPPPVPKKDVVKNPLAGLIRCGKCGHSIVLRPNGRTGMLYCPNRACDNVGSKFDIVEERLLQGLSDWLSSYRLEWSDKPPADEQALIDLKQKSLRKAQSGLETLHKQLDRTHDLLEQGVYDTDTFLSRSRSLTERIASAEADIEKLSSEVLEDEKRLASRRSIIPKVEKLLEVYNELPSAQAKNEMLKEVLEKAEYTKLQRSGRCGPFDNFELVLYPKLPPSFEN